MGRITLKMLRKINVSEKCYEFFKKNNCHNLEIKQVLTLLIKENKLKWLLWLYEDIEFMSKHYPLDILDKCSQLLAVIRNVKSFKYINNLSEELKVLVIMHNAYYIKDIKNPSEDLKKLAIEQNGYAIIYIKNPSVEVQKIAVNNNPKVIQCINNPSKEVLQLIK